MDCKICVVVNLLSLVMFVSVQVQCSLSEIEKISARLDELLVSVETPEKSIRDSETELWHHYEFGTGVGNRDELSITNITTKIDPELSNLINNYQYVEREDEFFLAGSNESVFSFHHLDHDQGRSINRTDVKLTNKILNFKLLSVPNSEQSEANVPTILAILCVESQDDTELLWYRFTGKELVLLDSWLVKDRVERLQYFHHEGQNRLLIVKKATPIDIYGFTVTYDRLNLWFSRRLDAIGISETLDLRVCPTYESTLLALRRKNDVGIYEYEGDSNKMDLFHERQNVTSNSLRNVVCFESGYIRYLITSGPETALFEFFDGEFQHDSYSEHIFNEIGETFWIQSMPIDNYREESLLLVQLKNMSTVALSWTGHGFKKIALPNFKLDSLDLSQVTIIPKFGFVYGNKLVKIDTRLRETTRPVRDEMKKLLLTRNALAEVLRKQELILDETEIRINKSYFVNPEVTGFWNLTEVEAKNVIIKEGVSCEEVSIGSKKMTLEQFLSDQNKTKNLLSDLESELSEIRENLADAVPLATPEVTLNGDLFIDGSLNVRGTMSVRNLTFDYLNGISHDDIVQDFINHNDELIIEGKKDFESIDAHILNVMFINDVPISEIKFDSVKRDYSSYDFSKITKLKIEGNLNFKMINSVNWGELLEQIILANQSQLIPGITTIEGDLVADNINIERLNGLRYPEDYVLAHNADTIYVTGKKKFEKLIVGTLDIEAIKTINGVSIDEYVTVNGDRTLKEDITFDNLIVTESLQVDGKVTGMPEAQQLAGLTLKETLNITADVVFASVSITGDFEIENSLNGTTWSQLDDLVSKDDEVVTITGEKVFLSEVEVDSDIVIENRTINGRSLDEFVTLDSDQEFPNLEKISGNVTFGEVTRGDLESLKILLKQNLDDDGLPECSPKTVIFMQSPIVDDLMTFEINGKISTDEFSKALNRTFSNVLFQNLEVTNLRVGEIVPIMVNNENLEKLKTVAISKTKPQVLTGDYVIDVLKSNSLNIQTIDGFTTKEVEKLRIDLDHIYNGIIIGNVTIDTLTVEGSMRMTRINGQSVQDIYDPDTMETIIFEKDIYIENLIVDGLINGINFTEFVEDSVLKTDTNIVITGEKTFDRIICESLEASSINGKSVDTILDPAKHQVLNGSIRVNGTVRVLNRFETEDKIGGISWQKLRERFRYMGNDTYSVNGDVVFTSEDVEIENLYATDSIQKVHFNDFIDSVVYLNSKNITIYGPVVFKAPVTIDVPLIITETYNDLDLKYFYDHAIRIDQPMNVKSEVVFTNNISIGGDLIVHEQLEAKLIGGVDLKELYENALFVDRPMAFSESVTLQNVVFDCDIEVEILNDIDLSNVITLEGDQNFSGTLHSMNITVGKLDIDGTLNGHDLSAIYDDTFLLTGDQIISRHIAFTGNVHIHNDFNVRLINGIDPMEMITLDGNDTLIGNFIFEHPLILHGNLYTNGLINDIDLKKWQAASVTKRFPMRQIVRGTWTIHGNVYLEKSVYGTDFLDGVNVTKFVDDVHKHDVDMELIKEGVEKDLNSLCEDLRVLKVAAENQIYKYKYFDYLQVFNFDRRIVSVHHFDFDDFDYLLVNFDTCHLDIFVFTGTGFTVVTSLSNVGHIDSWLTLRLEDQIYFLTVGKYACGKNSGNLWTLYDEQFIHVYDLGNITDAKKIKDNEFLIVVDGIMIRRTIDEIYQRSLSSPRSYGIGTENVKFVADSSEILLVNRETIYEYQFENGTNARQLTNVFGTKNMSSFRVGIYEREVFIYYDEHLSEEYLFISNNNWQDPKIIQTIKAQRPSSVIVLNLDGFVENLLMFVENRRILRIYEYQGIMGFVYRETIKMKADKLFKFKIRKYAKLAKKHCVAVVADKRLVIMEAKMYGEKLDMGSLPCEH